MVSRGVQGATECRRTHGLKGALPASLMYSALDATMDGTSPACRLRRTFARIGVLVSVCAFIILGLGDLVEQWIGGYASARFMLGTVFINAGICLGLFGVIAAVGFGLSFALPDDVPY